MSWYLPTAAAPDLARELVCGWTANAAGTHRLVPDGCVDVLYIAGVGVRVCGPETAPWTFTLPAGTEAVGIRFRPGVAPAILATSAAELRNTQVGLDDLAGSFVARTVTDRLDNVSNQSARLEVLQQWAREWRHTERVDDPLATRIGAALLQNSWSVAELADAASLTERQLHRRCNDAFGYGPATVRSILRLQRFMALARRRSAAGLAELAVEAGYADQSHLSRDCRRIADQTPSELLTGEAPDWHGGAALFVVQDVRNIQADHAAGGEESAA